MLTPSYELVTMREPDSSAAEAFRILRTNISLRDFDKKIKVINVISPIQGESKTTIALNLAFVYSQLGLKVLAIDMDLRLPTMHKKLQIRNKAGLTDVIGGRTSFEDAVIHYTDNMDVLLSGSRILFGSEFVESQKLRDFVEEKRNEYDMIIIDCPPVNIVADGTIISAFCDGTLLCVASERNDRKDLLAAKDSLELADINILGIVMTRVDVSKKKYSYKYGYYHRYGDNYAKRKK